MQHVLDVSHSHYIEQNGLESYSESYYVRVSFCYSSTLSSELISCCMLCNPCVFKKTAPGITLEMERCYRYVQVDGLAARGTNMWSGGFCMQWQVLLTKTDVNDAMQCIYRLVENVQAGYRKCD